MKKIIMLFIERERMKIIKQAFCFFGISGIGWLIDFSIYIILSNLLNINVDIANMISSFIGVSFVFFISTRKVFINNKISLRIKYIIYVVYQILLIVIFSKIMLFLNNWLLELNWPFINNYISIVVKIIVTPFTMIINYIVMKLLIEKL